MKKTIYPRRLFLFCAALFAPLLLTTPRFAYGQEKALVEAARKEGMKTCFVKRPLEWGPAGPPDPTPNPGCDLVVDGFEELAAQMGC